MLVEKKKIGKYEAIILKDDIEDQYTITYDGIGGAIISNKDKDVAEKKWKDAMALSDAVYKLNKFEKTGKF